MNPRDFDPRVLNPRDDDVAVSFVWAYLELELGDFDSSRGLTCKKYLQAIVNPGI